MPKPSKFQLTPEQLQAVEADLISPKYRHRRRAQALKRLHEGHSITSVAKEIGVSRQTVHDWINQYGIQDNFRNREIAFVQAIVEALQEKDWVFEDLHATLEQRLGRSIDPNALHVKLLLIRPHAPHLHSVTWPK